MAYASYQKKDYLQSDKVSKAESELTDYKGQKPGDYSSKYQEQIDKLYGQISNRPKFKYNVNEDALYQSMAQRYRQQGKQAMLDVMGQAATMTGGYGSSYAQSVGQQTYQKYLQSLADLVPDYYQMALDAYNAEGDDLYRQYSMALDREGTDYSRWQDKNNAYLQELNRLQGVYESERNFDYNKWAADQDFDYNSFINDRDLQYKQDRDTVADDQWMKEWERQQERDRVSDEQWERQFNESRRQWEEQMAFQREQLAAQAAAKAAQSVRSSSGGGSGGYDIAAEYNGLRQSGASTRDSDSYLKAAISAGLISEREATELRNSRYGSSKSGSSVTPSKNRISGFPNR